MREKILELLRQRPFQPFLVRLSNNVVHLVRHPEQVLVTPSYLEIGVPIDGAPGPEVSTTVFVSLIHIAEVDVVAPATPAASDGASSR